MKRAGKEYPLEIRSILGNKRLAQKGLKGDKFIQGLTRYSKQ